MKQETLAEYVARILEERGLKPSDVEKRSGHQITDGYVNNILSGKQKNLSIDKLVALATGLGVAPQDILFAATGLPPHEPLDPWPSPVLSMLVQSLLESRQLSDIVKDLMRMDEEQLTEVGKYIQRKRPR